MIRTQIQLTEEQARALHELASLERVSMAERRRRALAIVGQFHSDASDVSERHDAYLAET